MNSKGAHSLDAIDWRLIEELQVDARVPLSRLGKRVGLSQPAISERVRRLEAAGVIEGYTARINYQAVGLDLLAVVRVKTTFDKLQPCIRMFASMPEILEVYRVTGEDCFVLKVIVARAQQLESVIDQLAKHGSVTTSIVLSSQSPTPVSKRIMAKK